MFIKACLVLAIAFAVRSNKDDHDFGIDSKSESIDSGSSDSESLENRKGYDTPYLNMRGELRKTMAYHVLTKNTRRSSVCSPLGALMPLGKLAIGTSSRHYKEFEEATGYRRHKILKRFKDILDGLSHIRGKLRIGIASRLYVSRDETIRPKFTWRAKAIFKSGCERVDFNNPRVTARNIDDWVAHETNGQIRNVINPNDFRSTTSLVTVDAVYFGGLWKKSFQWVRMGKFDANGRRRDIQMMYSRGRYNYMKSNHLKAEIVEIPYAANGVSMIVVLPFRSDGLPSLLRQLDKSLEYLNSYMKQMEMTDLKLIIPKFRVASKVPMEETYKKIGLRKIFKPKNDVLTKVVTRHSVYVSKSYQAATLIVDERGSEGGFVAVMNMEKPGGKEFKADHPFLFFVVANDEQLFAGTYVD